MSMGDYPVPYMDHVSGTASAPGGMVDREEDLVIGSLDEGSRFLDGWMEDVRLWNRVLSEEEIAKVANLEGGKSLSNDLVGHWICDSSPGEDWISRPPAQLTGVKMEKKEPIQNAKEDGYRGVWYMNQPSGDEYVFKYSGGLGTYCAKHIPHAWYATPQHPDLYQNSNLMVLAPSAFFILGGLIWIMNLINPQEGS